MQEFLADQIDDRVHGSSATRTATRIPAMFAKMCDGPHVLSHADWRLDNLFIAPDDDVIAVDWQLIDRSVGPRDLAYFVTQSVNVNEPGRLPEAVRHVRRRARGARRTVDREWAWEMYRYGAMMGFVYPVVAGGALSIEDDRHIELTGAMLRRSVNALDALDAFDLPL